MRHCDRSKVSPTLKVSGPYLRSGENRRGPAEELIEGENGHLDKAFPILAGPKIAAHLTSRNRSILSPLASVGVIQVIRWAATAAPSPLPLPARWKRKGLHPLSTTARCVPVPSPTVPRRRWGKGTAMLADSRFLTQRISLARRSSEFSGSSPFSRVRSSVVSPASARHRSPLGGRTCEASPRSCRTSPRSSRSRSTARRAALVLETMRMASSRSSCGVPPCLVMAPSSTQELEPPRNPGRFSLRGKDGL